LWKNLDPKKASFAHLMSIIYMINEKFRENLLSVWGKSIHRILVLALAHPSAVYPFFWSSETFRSRPSDFAALLDRLLSLKLDLKTNKDKTVQKMSLSENIAYSTFLTNAFQSMEDTTVRTAMQK
jgi:hypothetical protein